MHGIEYRDKRIPCCLIVFDKDGTLIDFASTWIPLFRKRVSLLVKTLARNGDLEARLLRSWGIDPTNDKIDPLGPCPVSTRSDEIINGTTMLYHYGYPWNESKQRVEQAFDQADTIINQKDTLRPVDGIHDFILKLREKGLKLALATADERIQTEAALSALQLGRMFDIVLCAGDTHQPKPHPETILSICHKLCIDPQETVLFGDTVADMIMGRRAGVAVTIGVLQGGVTPREELEKAADIVVDSIKQLRVY